ncbi:metabolite traffic protein EboE [Pelagicoccus sp. SDUM812002]|uniref:metabolite traffic protein EboE n=1 Tax=Pelagicoccus sp. SDUM812002 TaxID=3041266 RepID=UPI00280E6B6B|nr:metabolite traffic protein EboE [Pelagicoccus sp. SDUM812002]MDQ8186693.1 metabolite traffic protein EboE [Pelagicoccus sp. SDUM812002]
MRLQHQAHLAYCTNVHPGKDWEQTFHSLQNEVLSVRRSVCPDSEYAIGLRLSATAARDLEQPQTLLAFQRWLDKENCYVFTINGFPYGDFHNTRVKENVYLPDWTSPDRLAYTQQLFDLLVQLLPSGVSGSVSTVPGSFKPFNTTPEQLTGMHENLYQVFQHIERLSERHDTDLHLGLEPEPLCLFETTPETIAFFEQFLDQRPDADAIRRRIGVNYDTCHLALQYEDAAKSLDAFTSAGIRISKLHLSSALKIRDFSPKTLSQLDSFCEPTYLHQVLAESTHDPLYRYLDLPEALEARRSGQDNASEWRIHFHIPLHTDPSSPLLSTSDHLLDALDYVAAHPNTCQHFEMETYTWAVMPGSLHSRSAVDQVTSEYKWLLPQLKQRSLIV